MRFWTRIKFHHNLINLFPPAQYTKTHPEFFPILKPGGTQRYLPADKIEDWQPCFTAPGIVDEAAKNIIKYLDDNPRICSYSFGINDTTSFCQCEVCRREYVSSENFLGLPSYSEPYYRFVNAVIEKVLKVHPNAWFGCLAYNNVGTPPVHFNLHPRLIPFLTYDTMHLLDPQRRKDHEALVEAWGKKCSFLGRYDYTYGADHVPPRIYLHHWANYVRWARNHKVKAWYAETYPFFGEAPKYYVMSKIWWNPDRDVDTLLGEWYRLAFGKAAAPMKAYFDHWENYWTKRVPKTGYFQQVQNDQFILGSTGWLENLQASDIEKAGYWIGQAQKLANTPETKARVAVMARSWEYYRAVMQTYLAQDAASGRRSVDDALAMLQSKNMAPDLTVKTLHEKLMQDPILTFTWKTSYPYKDSARAPFLDGLETYFDTRDERISNKLKALSKDPNAEMAALAAASLAIAAGTAQNLVTNPGFEATDPLDGWWAGAHQGTGVVRLTAEKPYEGTHAVQIEGTSDGYGGVFRSDIPVKAGKRYLFVLRSRWEGKSNNGTVCKTLLYFNDAKGALLPGSLIGNSFRCSAGWRTFVLQSPVAPEGAVTLTARADAAGQPPGHKAYFDDLRVYEIGSISQ